MPTVDRIITEAIVEDHASQALTNISRKIRDYIDEQRKGADGTARLSDAQRRQLNQLKSTERAFESLRRQIEPAYDQMKRLEQAQRTLDSAMKQGLATEQQAVSILERYKAQLSGTSDALSKTASAYNQLRSQIDPTFAKTQQLAAAQNTLNAAMKAGLVTQQQATAQLAQYEAQLNKAHTVNQGFIGRLGQMQSAFFGIQGILLTLGIGRVVGELASFDEAMAAVQAITGATSEEMEVLGDRAREMGATTKFTATEAAEGLRILAMSGMSAADSIEVIDDVLTLAVAGSLELGRAADIATSAMAIFGLSSADAGRAVDVLAAAATSSKTTVEQMGVAFRQVGGVAAAAGVSIEDAAAAISVMADNGIKGEQAGTALRSALGALLGPTENASRIFREMGINLAELDTSNPAEMFKALADAGIDAKTAFEAFDNEAASAVLILAANAEKMAALSSEYRKAEGAATRMADIMSDQLGGDIKALGSALSEVILALGEAGLTKALRAVIQVGTEVARTIANIVGALTDFFGTALRATAEALGLSDAQNKAESAADTHAKAIKALNEQMGKASAASGTLTQQQINQAKASLDAGRAALKEAEALQALAQAAAIADLQQNPESMVFAGLPEQLDFLSKISDEYAKAKASANALNAEIDALENTLGRAGVQLESTADSAKGLVIGINSASNAWNDSVKSYERAKSAAEAHADALESLKGMLNAGLIDQATYNDQLADANKALRETAGAEKIYNDSLKGTTSTRRAALGALEKLSKATVDYTQRLTEEMEGLQRILEAYEQSEAAGQAMAEQIERENEVRQLGLDLTTDTAQALIEELEQRDKLIDSIDDLKGGYADAAKAAEETAKQQADAYKQLGDSIQTNLSDAFYQVFSQGASSIKDLFNQIKNWFFRLLADMAAAEFRIRIMPTLGVSGPGALASGAANAATGGGGGGLFGNGAGLLGGGYGSILTGAAGLLGAGSGFGLGLSAAGAAFTDFGLLGGIGASFGNGVSLLASGSIMAGIGATLAAAVPIIGAVLAIVSLFRKESVPKATGKIQLNPDDLGYDILQNSGKHGATPEPLMKALEAFQESYVETIDALDLGMEALVIEFHQRKDKFHALVGPIDNPTAFFTEDVDIEDQAAVADAINQTLLAALAQSDTSEASEALAAFLDSVTLDGIKNLEQGQAQQIIEWMLNLGDAADVAAGNLPYLADAIRGLGSQGVEIPELQTFTDSLIAIGVALDTTPFEAYEEAVANSNKSMLTQLGEAQGNIMDMIAEFDGSAESTQRLAQSVLAYKDAATQAAAIIAQMQEAISSAVDSSIERIKLDTMSQEERYTYFLSQADAMKQALAEATDPEQIAQLFDQFQRYTEAAWQTLTDEQKQQQRDLFIDMLREGGDIANERLAAATEILSAQFEEMSNAVTLGMLDAFERAGLITEGAAAAFRQEIELSISTATDKLDELAMVMGAQFEAAGDMVGVAMVESSQDLLESLRGAGVNLVDALGAAGLTVEEALGLGAVDLAALLTEAGIDVNKILADAGLESAKALEDSALIASGALVGAADRIDAAAATLDNISIDVSQSGQPPITIELDGQDLEDLLAGYPVHAASGYIGRPGSVGPDNIPIMVGRGEAVINRHQQSVIDQSLRQTHGAGIGALFGGAPKHTDALRAERGFFQGFETGGTIDDLPTLDDFMRELGRRLNQALGQGLFNQIDDLMAQHQDDLSIAEQIGADVEQVTAVFEAELAKLLESANLTADELALLSDRFPELADEASRLAQQLAAAAEAAREAAAAQLENDLSRRLNDLQGNGAINAMNDLLGWLNDTLASAEELGVSADLVQQVFGEELDALLAGLDISQLQALQAAFPDLADAIGDVVDQLIQAAAEASAELAAALENDLSRRLNELTGNGAINALNDLVAWLDETLASAEELGVSADLVNQVFGEELSALLAGLDMDQLEALLDAFPQFGDAIGDAINDLAEQLAAEAEAARQELEAALSRELMSDVEGSLFDLIQWLQETAASAEELGADLGLVNDVFQQRFGGLLDSLSADQLGLLIELLPQFEDALGDLYDGLLEAAEAAKITADAYAALDALRLSVEAEKDRITAEYEAARQLAEQQYDAEIQRLQAAYDDRRAALLAAQEQETERVSAGIDRVSESLRNLADLSAIIGNAIDRLTDDAGDLEIRGSRLRQAEAELAVMAMLSRNVLPDAADLERVINAVTADNAALFSTREDYLRSRGVAANQLGQIGGAVDARVGEQERLLAAMEQQLDDLNTLQDAQLAALEMEMEAQEQHYDELLTQLDDAYQNQIDALDKLVSDAEAQLNALLGINDGILSVTDAIIQMHQTLAALELHQTTDTPTAPPPQLEPERANGNDELVRQVRSLRNEVSAQRAENAQLQMNIVKYSQQTAKSLSRWDVDGLPAERTV